MESYVPCPKKFTDVQKKTPILPFALCRVNIDPKRRVINDGEGQNLVLATEQGIYQLLFVPFTKRVIALFFTHF